LCDSAYILHTSHGLASIPNVFSQKKKAFQTYLQGYSWNLKKAVKMSFYALQTKAPVSSPKKKYTWAWSMHLGFIIYIYIIIIKYFNRDIDVKKESSKFSPRARGGKKNPNPLTHLLIVHPNPLI
jgi:hypothetical protein